MSERPVEATEPVAATIEGAVKNEPVTAPVESTEVEVTNGAEGKLADVKVETTNGSSQAKVKNDAVNTKGEDQVKDEDRKAYVPRRREAEGENLSKYDASVLPVTDDPTKIRNQVEFYFSDSNLPRDNYLWTLCDGPSNLPVSIEKICSFSRMKRFKPISAVVEALKGSKVLKVTGPDGDEGVSRNIAYDPAYALTDISRPRSIYAKGFGDEQPSTQFDIEAFFSNYGATNAVRLRRSPDKAFKGSVFVEFADEETQQKFLALDPKPLWKGEHELKICSKQEYVEAKNLDMEEGRLEPSRSGYRNFNGNSRGRGRGRGGDRGGNRGGNRGGYRDRNDRDRSDRDRGDRDPTDWKKRREEDRANGFKDDRKARQGRGRGGRGGNRDREDRHGRLNDRNREREEKNGDVKSEESKDEKKPEVKGENEPTAEKKADAAVDDAPTASSPKNVKRVREDDGGAEEQPSKKVAADNKSDEAS